LRQNEEHLSNLAKALQSEFDKTVNRDYFFRRDPMTGKYTLSDSTSARSPIHPSRRRTQHETPPTHAPRLVLAGGSRRDGLRVVGGEGTSNATHFGLAKIT
jgi:hypothetical protein